MSMFTLIHYVFVPSLLRNRWIIFLSTTTPIAERKEASNNNMIQQNHRKTETSWLRDIPTIPTITEDRNLIILSANAARLRYGGCVTFVIIFPQDVSRVIRKGLVKNATSSIHANLHCVFDDGSNTSAYTADVPIPHERVSIIDCPFTNFAQHQLSTDNRHLHVLLVTQHQHNNRSTPIAQAFITLPRNSTRNEQDLLTLCTSPLKDSFNFLPQWIEYHRQVGFRKFVIYNTSDIKQELRSIIDIYSKTSPELIDVVQWNFDHLGLRDWHSRRYFQVEAVHDCLFRYGDQTDWLGIIDLDEYIVPLPPYRRVDEYLKMNFKREEIGSIVLQSFFFCGNTSKSSTMTNPLVIERFTRRAKESMKRGRTKYLCRPRFVQTLGIHLQYYGLPSVKPSEKELIFAHYVSMDHQRNFPECATDRTVEDTRVRNLFGEKVRFEVKQRGF